MRKDTGRPLGRPVSSPRSLGIGFQVPPSEMTATERFHLEEPDQPEERDLTARERAVPGLSTQE